MRRQIDTHLESTLPPHPPPSCPPWLDQLSTGARRITTRRFETAEMAQGGRNSRLHHTGVCPEGACCAARIRPTAWTGARAGESRGGGHGELEMLFGVRLPNRRKLGRILHGGARSWEEKHRATNLDCPRACCWPLPTSLAQHRRAPMFLARTVARRVQQTMRQAGRFGGQRLGTPKLDWAWPISKWYDDTRPWCSGCWAESTN